MTHENHPVTHPIITVLSAIEAVLDDQASLSVLSGSTSAEHIERGQSLAAEITANTSSIEDALPPALQALAGINDLLLAVHGAADVETPDSIRPLSWLAELIKECKARGPASDCEDPGAFWEMVQEVEMMHAGALAALKTLVVSFPPQPIGFPASVIANGRQMPDRHSRRDRVARRIYEATPGAENDPWDDVIRRRRALGLEGLSLAVKTAYAQADAALAEADAPDTVTAVD